jgi:NADH:ubiquinone oxidoreductase subunit 6 (subunit J)
MNVDLAAVPIWLLVLVALLAVAEIALDVVALLDLYRRPREQVVLGNKWFWVVIIVLVNILGAIVYLAAGRQPAASPEGATPPRSPSARTEDIADSLYGPRDESRRP